jgi:hypothetical protein
MQNSNVNNERSKLMIANYVYKRAFERALFNKNIEAVIYCGTRYINSLDMNKSISKCRLKDRVEDMSIIVDLMANRKPKEFINIFPITKEYNGEKEKRHDYFSTMKMIEKMDQDKPIGEDINHLLFIYANPHVLSFAVRMINNVDKLRRLDGKCGILEESGRENNGGIFKLYKNNRSSQSTLYKIMKKLKVDIRLVVKKIRYILEC